MSKQLLTVIAPMYNEEAIVEEYCEETVKVLEQIEDFDYEILLVNDGSKDTTWDKMKEMYKRYEDHISLINLTRNFGLEGAVNAGLKMAQGDIVVAMDADLQDPPELILEMIKKYKEGADIVIANRIKRSNDNLFKRASANLYYRVLDDFSGKIHLERGAANYRLLSRKAVDVLKNLPEVNGVFRVTSAFIGMKTSVVEYDRNKRFAGKTKYNLKSMIRYALDSITDISIEPLRKIPYCLGIAAIGAFVNIIGLLVGNTGWKGYFYIGLLVSVFFGGTYIVLALIGEYIGQILLEVKHRPTSLIYDYIPAKSKGEN